MTTVERDAAKSTDSALLVELADALRRVRNGNFKVRLPRRTGLAGEVVDGFNEVVELQQRRNRELLRISRVVGREGKMTERVDEESFEGDWAEGVRAVNSLIDDLGRPTTEIGRVIVAVAEGDLSQKMANEIEGRPLRGEFLRIGRAVNTMVDQLSSFADEVTRVAREVGTEGKLGGQADVRGVSGTWRDLTDNVNLMAANLTNQVRSIAEVATAVAHGDLSRKITVSAKGEVAELADTINSLTDTLRLFAEEVTRVAREVGTEGKLGGQAEVPGVAGTWKDLTESVNSMASNLTSQVRNIAQVATAVANGDLSQKITVAALGEILELKDTVNTMVDQLSSFADEVTRVAREVGTEGQAGRAGPGARGRRYVAGSHREREPARLQPDVAGAQHRPGDHRGGPGRPVPEDHGRCPGRDPGAEVHREHHGRPVVLVRRRGHARGPRGRYGRQARRSGTGDRGRRYVAGPHRQREPHGLQPDQPGAQHRPGGHGGGPGRPEPEDHG